MPLSIQGKKVPEARIREVNRAAVNPAGDYVLYWMIANRRLTWNFSLERALEWAKEFKKPLVILEALRCGYPWASERLHRFILDGMNENAGQAEKAGVLYYPYVEDREGGGKGLLETLSAKACVVVTDDFPAFFLPRMLGAAAAKLSVRLEALDSNGLLPMRAADRVFPTAYAFRRFLQKNLPEHLGERPRPYPLRSSDLPRLKALPREFKEKWPPASKQLLSGKDKNILSSLPIDHSVNAALETGGSGRALRSWRRFLKNRLHDYPQKRNEPEEPGTSGVSPFLHFGQISVHQIFHDLANQEGWSMAHLSEKTTGGRSGWWGMSEAAEAFLDELVTWRELGFNMCWQRRDYDQYDSLPGWAQKTLEDHRKDVRPYVYTLEDFEKGRTHDPLWNAAQMQLVREGRIHNYLRMLWGKKILHWSESPQEALAVMIELNNTFALDGRDPNSYSGIFWVLGRYDRAWGPERSVFGKVRYMSSKNTARKYRVTDYIRNYAP